MSEQLTINASNKPVVMADGDEPIKNPMKPNKQKKKKKGPALAPVWMLYRYNGPLDYCFMLIGLIGSIVSGLGMPAFALLFQSLLNDFNPSATPEKLYSKTNSSFRLNQRSSYLLSDRWCDTLASYLSHVRFLWSRC